MARLSRFIVPLALVLVALPSAARAQHVVGLGAGIFADDGTFSDREQRDNIRESEESFEFFADSSLVGGVWYLRQATDRLRLGGGLRYYGTYGLIDREDEDDEPEPYELGRLTEAYAQAEFAVPVTDDTSLLLGGQVGPSILFPGGDFRDDIDRLDDQGVGVWSLPRLGLHLGPQVGGVYRVSERLSARADAILRYEHLFLFAVDDEVDSVQFEKSSTTGAVRYELGLAIEVDL